MSDDNTGGLVHPFHPGWKAGTKEHDDTIKKYGGLTILDYFAAKAMQAIVTKRTTPTGGANLNMKLLVGDCYDIAESMLAEKQRRQRSIKEEV